MKDKMKPKGDELVIWKIKPQQREAELLVGGKKIIVKGKPKKNRWDKS